MHFGNLASSIFWINTALVRTCSITSKPLSCAKTSGAITVTGGGCEDDKEDCKGGGTGEEGGIVGDFGHGGDLSAVGVRLGEGTEGFLEGADTRLRRSSKQRKTTEENNIEKPTENLPTLFFGGSS